MVAQPPVGGRLRYAYENHDHEFTPIDPPSVAGWSQIGFGYAKAGGDMLRGSNWGESCGARLTSSSGGTLPFYAPGAAGGVPLSPDRRLACDYLPVIIGSSNRTTLGDRHFYPSDYDQFVDGTWADTRLHKKKNWSMRWRFGTRWDRQELNDANGFGDYYPWCFTIGPSEQYLYQGNRNYQTTRGSAAWHELAREIWEADGSGNLTKALDVVQNTYHIFGPRWGMAIAQCSGTYYGTRDQVVLVVATAGAPITDPDNRTEYMSEHSIVLPFTWEPGDVFTWDVFWTGVGSDSVRMKIWKQRYVDEAPVSVELNLPIEMTMFKYVNPDANTGWNRLGMRGVANVAGFADSATWNSPLHYGMQIGGTYDTYNLFGF